MEQPCLDYIYGAVYERNAMEFMANLFGCRRRMENSR